MENYIIIAIIVAILGFAIRYIIRAKKSGKKCIGCPDSCSCSSKQSQCSCCNCESKTEK